MNRDRDRQRPSGRSTQIEQPSIQRLAQPGKRTLTDAMSSASEPLTTAATDSQPPRTEPGSGTVRPGAHGPGLATLFGLPRMSQVAQAKLMVGEAEPEGLDLPTSGGATLDPVVRRDMEAALGADFSNVRTHIHAGLRAAGVRAVASGDHIHFSPGELDLHSRAGLSLLGHELAHVVQQRAGRVDTPARTAGTPISTQTSLEQEADEAGSHVAAGRADFPAPEAVPVGATHLGTSTNETVIEGTVAQATFTHYGKTLEDQEIRWQDVLTVLKELSPSADTLVDFQKKAKADAPASLADWLKKRNVDISASALLEKVKSRPVPERDSKGGGKRAALDSSKKAPAKHRRHGKSTPKQVARQPARSHTEAEFKGKAGPSHAAEDRQTQRQSEGAEGATAEPDATFLGDVRRDQRDRRNTVLARQRSLLRLDSTDALHYMSGATLLGQRNENLKNYKELQAHTSRKSKGKNVVNLAIIVNYRDPEGASRDVPCRVEGYWNSGFEQICGVYHRTEEEKEDIVAAEQLGANHGAAFGEEGEGQVGSGAEDEEGRLSAAEEGEAGDAGEGEKGDRGGDTAEERNRASKEAEEEDAACEEEEQDEDDEHGAPTEVEDDSTIKAEQARQTKEAHKAEAAAKHAREETGKQHLSKYFLAKQLDEEGQPIISPDRLKNHWSHVAHSETAMAADPKLREKIKQALEGRVSQIAHGSTIVSTTCTFDSYPNTMCNSYCPSAIRHTVDDVEAVVRECATEHDLRLSERFSCMPVMASRKEYMKRNNKTVSNNRALAPAGLPLVLSGAPFVELVPDSIKERQASPESDGGDRPDELTATDVLRHDIEKYREVIDGWLNCKPNDDVLTRLRWAKTVPEACAVILGKKLPATLAKALGELKRERAETEAYCNAVLFLVWTVCREKEISSKSADEPVVRDEEKGKEKQRGRPAPSAASRLGGAGSPIVYSTGEDEEEKED